MDSSLQDDMLKLVRYKMLFVRRDYELAFPEREELVADNIKDSDFIAWKVAEFIQELARGETAVPRKWLEQGYPPPEHTRNGRLIGLPEEDKKYLRVYYEVLERYQREESKYEEQNSVDALEKIKNAISRE